MELPTTLLRTLETAINQWLKLDPACAERLGKLQGRCIGIELRGTGMMFYMLPGAHGLRIRTHTDQPADTVLHGTPLAMARLGMGGDIGKSLFSGDVTITGDVETGQAFREILDDMEIDWEEQLARFTGDITAHQIGRAAGHAGRLLRNGRATLEQDLGEYLQEELRVLPARVEVENFSTDVDTIRADVDRLELRIRRLLDSSGDRT